MNMGAEQQLEEETANFCGDPEAKARLDL